MLSNLLTVFLQNYGPLFSGIAAGVICKAYFNSQLRNKIKDYQDEILKCNDKICELEALNENLVQRLKETEVYFSKEHINLN